jgi:hypothetical protein
MRREFFCQSVEDRADGAEPALDPLRLVLDGRAVLGDQHLLRLRPFEDVEIRHVGLVELGERALPELEPIAEAGHAAFYGQASRGVQPGRVSRL